MSIRRVAALLLAASAVTGCTARAKMLTGTTAVAASTLILVQAPRSTDCPQPCGQVLYEETAELSNGLTLLAGLGLAALGGGLVIAGVVQHAGDEEPAPAPIARVPEPAPRAPSTLGADVALRGKLENRLAIQASMAAHAGHCTSAVMTANQLAARDRELHAQLVAADPELARCYRM